MTQIEAISSLFVVVAAICYATPIFVFIYFLVKLLKWGSWRWVDKKKIRLSYLTFILPTIFLAALLYLASKGKMTTEAVADVKNEDTALILLKGFMTFYELSTTLLIGTVGCVVIYRFILLCVNTWMIIYKQKSKNLRNDLFSAIHSRDYARIADIVKSMKGSQDSLKVDLTVLEDIKHALIMTENYKLSREISLIIDDSIRNRKRRKIDIKL
ncbi:hypothetical protein H0243_14245 [Staphylococcus sciuri]|uniref:hypothetical protein n=1 Tax=Mammaliicoccus sciuri TaxID=1296 RepID=UPI0018C9851E|nr:hypothetical protein [Mammaliicoccus sciuri]MBG9206951.1 hypothetical protein [Mammaliicoccus sciuri]